MNFKATTIFGVLDMSIYEENEEVFVDAYIDTPLGNSNFIRLIKNYDFEITSDNIHKLIFEILEVYVDKLSEEEIEYKFYTVNS